MNELRLLFVEIQERLFDNCPDDQFEIKLPFGLPYIPNVSCLFMRNLFSRFHERMLIINNCVSS